MEQSPKNIRAIVGLGNPGNQYYKNRHNIGFRIVDELSDKHHGSWNHKKNFHESEITIDNSNVLLIKPQTFMNSSGEVVPYLTKQGIKADQILVVHDELELPFNKIQVRQGGSARGHNGLKSIINATGPDFWRMRIGVDRPDNREMVPDYVLTNFPPEQEKSIMTIINNAIILIEKMYS